jgi:hypothetical protein
LATDRDALRDAHSDASGATCVVKHCSMHDCRISLPRSAICIKCDLCNAFPDSTTRPDFVVFLDQSDRSQHVWTIVEVKGRLDDPTTILKQIQAGASAVEHHPLFRIGEPSSRLLIPVVLFRGHVHAADFQRYDRKPIRFGVQKLFVRAVRCQPHLALESLIERPSRQGKGSRSRS